MKIRNVSREEIIKALEVTNESFDGNIIFKRFDTAANGKSHTVTLTVNSSRGKGGRVSNMGRHIAAACWHAHGTFIDALPPAAVVETTGGNMGGIVKVHPGDRWQDRNIGSIAYPLMYSRACECRR